MSSAQMGEAQSSDEWRRFALGFSGGRLRLHANPAHLQLFTYPDQDTGANHDSQEPNVERAPGTAACPRVAAWWHANSARFAQV